MSGTAPGPDYPPAQTGESHPNAPPSAYGYQPPVPPPPRREGRDNTVRNLLIVLLIAIFTIVPATGMWVVASLKDNKSDESAPIGTAPAKAVATDTEPPVVVPPQGEPPATADPTPQPDPGPPGQGQPPQGQPPPGGGGHLCCCDGAPSKCTSPKKGCCQKHGGICPCQGGR